jgi:hypothetical protein
VPDIRSIINVDVWKRLSLDDRRRLLQLLPTPPSGSGIDADTFRVQTLNALFSGADLHFGNPLVDFGHHMQRGSFHPKAVAAKRSLIEAQVGTHC